MDTVRYCFKGIPINGLLHSSVHIYFYLFFYIIDESCVNPQMAAYYYYIFIFLMMVIIINIIIYRENKMDFCGVSRTPQVARGVRFFFPHDFRFSGFV